jgi:acyl-CoA reductase-like NAD-dependent aldehyde dehydrogenase
LLSVIPYESEADALRIANDSEYGLGGSVWTQDLERAEAFARRVQTGTIGINHYMVDPNAPFVGVKASGIGREFGPEGIEPYFSVQTIFRTAGGAVPATPS